MGEYCLTHSVTPCYASGMIEAITVRKYRSEVSRVPISKDNRRVYITLPGKVVEKLEKMASDQMRSLSSMTALMVIRGLESTEAKTSKADSVAD